jgi:gliding motility-associated-like protein
MTLKRTAFLIYTLTCVFFLHSQVFGQTTTFKSGTAIIDMGSATPTVKNSLKPYGLIFALLKNNQVPVYSIINPSKTKDGIDFIYNGKSYKGGTYIISKEHITTQVAGVLTAWANQGVLIDYTNSDLTVLVDSKLTFVPRWTMDRDYGDIAISFLSSAGIPASAYAKKRPTELGNCDDIFILPHADPTFDSHKSLYLWNKNQKGPIWAGCHAVSSLENLSGSVDIGGFPTPVQLNFLSSTGLVPFTEHVNGGTPYASSNFADPIAQYIGKTDNAQLAGSENVYLPKIGGAWNAGTKMLTYSPSQPDIPVLSPGQAAINIYGRAYDDITRGYVAYQAAHNIGGSTPDAIAAQRIFFNFSFFALNDKITPILKVNITGVPTELKAGVAAALVANVTGTAAAHVSYQWKATINGVVSTDGFSAPNSQNTTFTPNVAITPATTCVITCVVTDTDCSGRITFDSKGLNIIPTTPPIAANTINKTIAGGCTNVPLLFNVFDNNADPNSLTRTLTNVTSFGNGTTVFSATGEVSFTPNANFVGGSTANYTITDGITPSTGTINITVGDAMQAPSVTGDVADVAYNVRTIINVLTNDRDNPLAAGNTNLTIRDISVKPTNGYAQILPNNTIAFLSFSNTGAGTDFFNYVACNNLGFCKETRVDITMANATATLTNTATQDSYIGSDGGGFGGGSLDETSNHGSEASLVFSHNATNDHSRLPLFQFDVSSLSALAATSTLTVTSASLQLTVVDPVTENNVFPGTLFRIKTPWSQGSVTMIDRSTGLAWTDIANLVAFDQTGNSAWVDFLTVDDDAFSATNPQLMIASSNLTANQILVADVKDIAKFWISDQTNNNNRGLILAPNNSGTVTDPFADVKFHSTEGLDNTKAPKLVVTYQLATGTLTATNPIAYPDLASTTSSAAAITINALANDRNYNNVNRNEITSVVTSGTGSATTDGTTVSYKASNSFVGVETLTYTVRDIPSGLTSTATIRVTVTQVAPIVIDDVVATNSFSATTINVGANDTDPQGAMSAPVITQAPKNGTAVVNGNNIVYTPAGSFTGTDVLQYSRTGTAIDACATALSGAATVTVTVNNQPPVANSTNITTFACAPVDIKLLEIATDPESGVLTTTAVSTPSHGTLTVNANGSYKYTPNNGYTGTDVFTYKVKDIQNAVSVISGTVTITISGSANPNTAPVAVADTDITLLNQPVFTNVLFNDSDPNNDALSISITALGLTAPVSGTITLLPNKLVKYTPNTGFVGTDTYQYKITDTHPGCSGNGSLDAIATVTITVKSLPTTLSGTVWTDTDVSGTATFTNIKTNTETGTNGNGSLYVYLTDNTNKIIDKTPVDVDGTYQLSSVPSLVTNLKLVLSIEDLAVGNSISAGSVPAGYSNSSPLVRNLSTTTTADMFGFDWGIYTNPTLSPGTIVSPGNLCVSGVPGTLTATANATGGSLTATGYVYQWQTSPVADFSSGVTDISGATDPTYTPAATITVTTYYRRKVSTNVNTPVFSNIVSVQVNPKPTVNVGPLTATITANGNIVLTASGADNYSWSPATGLSATNTAVVTAGSLSATTMYAVTGTNTITGCVNTAGITVTVLDPGTIGNNQAACGPFAPATITSTSVASGTAGITYQWQSSITSSASDFSNIELATATSYTPSGPITTTTYYRRVAIVNGVPANSNVITATVNPFPTISITPTSATIAAGLTQTLTASGANTYIWSPATGLSETTTPSVIATPASTTTYSVTGRVTASGCTSTASVVVTVGLPTTLIPGTIGSPQTICSGATAGAFTSTAASGGTGTISYQWQSSTDNVTFTDIVSATSATYGAGTLSQTTYYRRGAKTSTDAFVYTPSVKINVLPKPVIIGGINGPCAMPKDTVKTFSVTPAANARYQWTIPAGNGWSSPGSTTNSINVKAGTTNGVISVTPFNGTCAGTAVTYNVSIIDYARVTISGTPVTASGNNNNPINVKIQLIDVLGNLIGCSGGPATLCTNSGSFTTVVDNGDGTYTSQLTSSANDVTICGAVAGVQISQTSKVTFTGPQGGIKSNGPILDFETPKITFTATAGRAPFTVIYHSAKSPQGKNDTLTNVTSGTAIGVALIPSTTLYTLVSVIDANGERRDNNFIRDTTTTIVLAPKVIITLKADAPVKEQDNLWSTRLVVHTKNIGDLDLSNSQARLNLRDVFPNPVTYVLDSVKVAGTTVVPNRNYDGILSTDLFARLNKKKSGHYTNTTATGSAMGMSEIAAPDGSVSMEMWGNAGDNQSEESDELTVIDDGHSIYMFGPQSALPVGVDATIILWLHVKPNGYTEPFVMQAVALGTGSTQGATALTTSLSNDNEDVSTHPEITKKGDPLPSVINLFPTALIGASLTAGAPVLQGDGTYNVTLSYKVKNYGNVNLRSVKLLQNLLISIGAPSTFSVVSPVVSTGNLIPNPAFDAKLNTDMLLPNSILGYKQESVLSFTINITPNQLSSVYRLQATASGFSDDLNTTVTDLSTDGTNPDPDGNNIPSEKIITTIVINLPVPPLVPGNIGIKTGPSTTVPEKAYCATATGIEIIPITSNSGGLDSYQYQWQSSADNITFTDVSGAEASIYTTGQVNNSFYLRRGTISGSQIKYSNSVYIQIYPAPSTPVITATGNMVVGKGNITLTSPLAASYAWSTGATTRSIVVTDAGDYNVTIADNNGCTAVATAYAITALDVSKVADIQKILTKAPALQQDGSYLLSFSILASNLRTELLDSIKIKDDLSKVFPSTTTFSVVDIKASGALISNGAYDGRTQIDLLNDVSKLAGSQTDSVVITIKVFPNGFAGTLHNVATLNAKSPYGSFSVSSNDPVANSNPAVRLPTKFVIPFVDIFIPSGFSPNRDGINDLFVITRPFNTSINLEIFNRWSNLVYKSADYKNEWNGKGNQQNRVLGEDLPDGTYYYVVLATDKSTGAVRKFAGFVTLKR